MATSDRISRLPEDMLDHILGFLPIQDIVRTTVLSTIWRDLWFTLTQLCFDRRFFSYVDKKNRTSNYVRKSCASYIINKVLLQHKGTIQKFAINLSQVGKVSIRSRSFDFDQCLDLVVRKGVPEVHLQFWGESYKLPNCIFSCSTVKSLHLCRINIVPIDFPHTLPYLTSLYFEDIRFGPADLPYYVIDVPMLKNLSFSNCGDISPFKVTARNLCNLTIKDCCSSQLCSIFPLASNLISIRTLDLHCESLQGLPQETDATNVELLKLEGFRFHNDGLTSAFVRLLCICPQLCKLEITFSWTDIKCQDPTPELLKKLRFVVQACGKLLFLKLRFFMGLRLEILFIKEMLGCLPALEKVIINWPGYTIDDNQKHEIMEEVLFSPRASIKAKIVY